MLWHSVLDSVISTVLMLGVSLFRRKHPLARPERAGKPLAPACCACCCACLRETSFWRACVSPATPLSIQRTHRRSSRRSTATRLPSPDPEDPRPLGLLRALLRQEPAPALVRRSVWVFCCLFVACALSLPSAPQMRRGARLLCLARSLTTARLISGPAAAPIEPSRVHWTLVVQWPRWL